MFDNITEGDFITDSTGIYKIVSIKTDNKSNKNKSDLLLYYKPVSESKNGYTASIPLNNLKKAGIRKVITQSEAKTALKDLSSQAVLDKYDFNLAKEEVYQNDPTKTIPILRHIWKFQNTLSKNDKDIMWQIIETLSREISFITQKNHEKVKQELIKKLGEPNALSPISA